MQTGLRRFITRLTFLLALSIPAVAHADRIMMNNGDIITGKISRVNDKEIAIQPSYAKKFIVKMSAVVSIETDEPLEVAMNDGRVMEARFGGVEESSLVLLVGEEVVPVDISELEKAGQPQPFYTRESSADGSITINEGNTQSRSSIFNIDTRLRLGDHRQYAVLTVRRDENNNVSTKKQTLFRYEYDWLFRKSWYLGATAAYERDPIRDLDHRFTFGALLGHDFLDDPHNFLTIKAGFGYTSEELGLVSSSGPVGLWEFEFHHDFKGGDLEFFHDNTLSYQHYGDNNVIVKSNTGFKLDILWEIYATASYRFNYESEPAPGRFNKDSTLAFGLGARF